VVPTTALEAKALIDQARTLGVSKLYVAGDGQPYGAALTAALRTAAAGITIVAGPSEADHFSATGAGALLYAGTDPHAASTLFNAVASADASAKLLAPSALDTQQLVSALSPAAQGAIYVSAPGVMSSQLSSNFTSAFQSATGHAPSPEAVFGYEAMQAVLAALRQAGAKANDRTTVGRNFFALHNRQGPFGTYSIDANGDTSFGQFVISRVRSGALVPYRSVAAQG
jgi:ABC-type branched-subunit amino acid transport system substrate-binding protein